MLEPPPRIPRRILPGLAIDVFLGRPRDLAADVAALREALGGRAVVAGLGAVPRDGPLTIVANHLQGPGLWIGWGAALITDAIARARGDTVRWAVSIDYDRRTVAGPKKLIPGTRWAFARVARAWSLVPVDPRRPGAAARELLALSAGGACVGIFPEGAVRGVDGLFPPQPAAMKLIDRLATRSALVPVALTLDAGHLVATFGPCVSTAAEAWRFIGAAHGGGAREADVALVAG